MAYRIKPAIRMLVKCEMCVRYGLKSHKNIRQALSWFHEEAIGPVFRR